MWKLRSLIGEECSYTEKHREFVNITRRAEDFVGHTSIGEGFMLMPAMHITAGVYMSMMPTLD